MICARHVVAAIFVCLWTWSNAAMAQQLTSQEIERRVNSLMLQMSLEEKVGQLVQLNGGGEETNTAIKQGLVGSVMNVPGAGPANALQHLALEQSRLKVPLIIGLDVIHGYRTVFPVPIGGASSFDLELIEQAERVAAKEATASGVKWVFAPMVDITRDPRWGRMVEGAGEDPYWGSLVAAAKVKGFQGKNMADADSVVACAKHYVAYGAAEGGRDYNTVEMSERLLREIYLPPFHSAVRAGVGTIMSAFDSLNGVPATANHHTLADILRGEWDFRGFVDADYNAVHELVAHGIAKDDKEAAFNALMAGVDMDMVDNAYGQFIPAMVRSGELPLAVVEEAVRRVLRIKFAAGLFDHPFTDPTREQKDLLTQDNLQVARQLAQESLVLLKNQNSVLPLSKKLKTIAVVGPLADDKAEQLGSWVGMGRAQDVVTPLEGIKAKLPGVQVLYAKGVDIPSFEKDNNNPLVAAPAPSTATGAAKTGPSTHADSIDSTVAAAKKSDVVVVFMGELGMMTGEASSRAGLDFPGRQMEMLQAIVATGKPIVLVLESGRPLDIRWANDHVSAIVQAWFPGVQAGHAIADVLFGDVSPSGRLPISWPRSLGQVPIYYNHLPTGRPGSSDRWHTGYVDESSSPLFPFGYGLNYTTFRYGTPVVLTPTVPSNGTLRVKVDVQNTGTRPGTEVVQLYVHCRVAQTSRPVRELKGLSRVTMVPGETKTIEFSVDAKDLGSYGLDMKLAVVPGGYDVWISPNAAEGEEATFEVTK